MLTHYKKNGLRESASSALLFQCLRRGSYLYGKPNHDTLMFKDLVGDIPLAGFFCNGEIGPVSGYTYLHGYTSAYGIFKPKLKEAN
jgi:small ligand-binding sensory domain FIST